MITLLYPLPWCVHGDCPPVDREFSGTEGYVIPFMKDVPGGEELHRIPKLASTHKACWHAVQYAMKDARDRSNDGLVLHEVTPLAWKFVSRSLLSWLIGMARHTLETPSMQGGRRRDQDFTCLHVENEKAKTGQKDPEKHAFCPLCALQMRTACLFKVLDMVLLKHKS